MPQGDTIIIFSLFSAWIKLNLTKYVIFPEMYGLYVRESKFTPKSVTFL